MEKLINRLADKLIKSGANPENRDVIVYGLEGATSEIFANLAAFTIAFIIGKPIEMLIWQVFWLPLRVNIGGHHAKHHISCLINSTAFAVVCILIVPFILSWWWFIVFEIIATLVVAFCFAPFVHPHRLATEQHIKNVRKRGKIIAIIEASLVVVFYFVFPTWVAHVAALGMFVATALCIIGHVDQYIARKRTCA